MNNRHIGAFMLIVSPAVLIGVAAGAAYFNSFVALGIGAIFIIGLVIVALFLITE